MRFFIAAVLIMFLQSAVAHRDVSDLIKERQEIKQLMSQNLLSIKESLNARTNATKLMTEQALYLSKASEFSAELFPKISASSASFSVLYRQLIAQTAKAYDLSLKNNSVQLSTQIQLITNTCHRCHAMNSLDELDSHKNE